jgi:hypothetical protein
LCSCRQTLIRSRGFPRRGRLGQRCAPRWKRRGRSEWFYLSTIGAQASQPNLLTQHTTIEQALSDLPMPIIFLRPAWFMENYRWDAIPAREHGVIPSFLQPLDKPVPMVATADIGKLGHCLAARTVERPPRGGIGRTAPRDSKRDRRCIHEGPGPVSANANRAARFLGGTFQVAGDEEPIALDADAEWL